MQELAVGALTLAPYFQLPHPLHVLVVRAESGVGTNMTSLLTVNYGMFDERAKTVSWCKYSSVSYVLLKLPFIMETQHFKYNV